MLGRQALTAELIGDSLSKVSQWPFDIEVTAECQEGHYDAQDQNPTGGLLVAGDEHEKLLPDVKAVRDKTEFGQPRPIERLRKWGSWVKYRACE